MSPLSERMHNITQENIRLGKELIESRMLVTKTQEQAQTLSDRCFKHLDTIAVLERDRQEAKQTIAKLQNDLTDVTNKRLRSQSQEHYLIQKSKRERDAALAAAAKLRERCSKHIQEAIETKKRHIDISLHLCRENQLLRTDNREMTNKVRSTIADNETLQREMDAIKRPWHWSNVVFSFLFTIGVIIVWKLLFG